MGHGQCRKLSGFKVSKHRKARYSTIIWASLRPIILRAYKQTLFGKRICHLNQYYHAYVASEVSNYSLLTRDVKEI